MAQRKVGLQWTSFISGDELGGEFDASRELPVEGSNIAGDSAPYPAPLQVGVNEKYLWYNPQRVLQQLKNN